MTTARRQKKTWRRRVSRLRASENQTRWLDAAGSIVAMARKTATAPRRRIVAPWLRGGS